MEIAAYAKTVASVAEEVAHKWEKHQNCDHREQRIGQPEDRDGLDVALDAVIGDEGRCRESGGRRTPGPGRPGRPQWAHKA